MTITVPNTLPELNGSNNAAAATTRVINLILTKEVRSCGLILPAAICPGSAVWSLSGLGKPGDVLEYRVSYLNSGTANATALVVADPVPATPQPNPTATAQTATTGVQTAETSAGVAESAGLNPEASSSFPYQRFRLDQKKPSETSVLDMVGGRSGGDLRFRPPHPLSALGPVKVTPPLIRPVSLPMQSAAVVILRANLNLHPQFSGHQNH
ncbi:hypothetical protein [Deinococcus sp. QL22]|uniref:hypothetical protein n=1 Tax=Deinococcus sp. QL22 TaxID=2939437 RepID=UPI002016FFBA|nr:hypothetical protein [Deinococcus sp. QL22]UQN08679.1 hypothetical protein M1R55_21385 [Deinococcus sp. QL22]